LKLAGGTIPRSPLVRGSTSDEAKSSLRGKKADKKNQLNQS